MFACLVLVHEAWVRCQYVSKAGWDVCARQRFKLLLLLCMPRLFMCAGRKQALCSIQPAVCSGPAGAVVSVSRGVDVEHTVPLGSCPVVVLA